MGAPRAWTTIVGQTIAGVLQAVIGEETLRTIYFDPAFARITKDTSVTPPRVVISSPAVEALDRDLGELTDRVETLETKRYTTTTLKVADYTAAAWEHVLTSTAIGGSFTVTLPTSPAPTVGDRVRVTDIGTIGNGETLSIACTFYVPDGGSYFPTSPYVVANRDGVSLAGASIELLYTAAGWVIVMECCKPELLL